MVQPRQHCANRLIGMAQGLPAAGYEREILGPPWNWGRTSYPGVIGWPACSSAGCWNTSGSGAPQTHWTIIWTNSPFRFNRRNSQSRGKLFYRWLSKLFKSGQVPTPHRPTASCWGRLSDGDTPIDEFPTRGKLILAGVHTPHCCSGQRSPVNQRVCTLHRSEAERLQHAEVDQCPKSFG